LGYGLCDDHDEDLQCAQRLLERSKTTKDDCTSANEPEGSTADSSELCSIQVPSSQVYQSWHFPKWRDKATGALLGYSPCEDEELLEHEHQQPWHCSEWKDQATGALLGYLPCEDEEALELNILFQGAATDDSRERDGDDGDLTAPEVLPEEEHDVWHRSGSNNQTTFGCV